MTMETLNEALARILVGHDTAETEVVARTTHPPRTLPDGSVVWQSEIEFNDDETGETLISRHWVTVARDKPQDYAEADEFDWEGES